MMNMKIQVHQRRGSVLLLILAVSMILTVIGMSALFVNRVHNRTTQLSHGFGRAQILAVSAMEQALQVLNRGIQTEIDAERNWRLLYSHDTVVTTYNLGGGSCSWKLRDDSDNDLNNGVDDNFWIYATGTHDDVSFTLRIEMKPPLDEQAMSCLDVAVLAGDDFVAGKGCQIYTDQIVAANDKLIIVMTRIISHAEAVDYVSGSTFHGTTTSGVTPRTLPGAEALDSYVAEGTSISWDSIPSSGDAGDRKIEGILLSPTVNPYGATNSNGVYIIDCQGNNLTIKDCRIVGTLVLLNSTSTTTISGSVNWQPAIAEYPSVLAEGDLDLQYGISKLTEAKIGKNLDPDGTPDEGTHDSDMTDEYYSVINGNIYSASTVWLKSDEASTIMGCIVAADDVVMMTNDLAQISRPSTIADSPPPGFTELTETAPPYPVSSTWEQVVTN